jgi:hypothetical protein
MPCSNCCRAKSNDKSKQLKKESSDTKSSSPSLATEATLVNKKCKHETAAESKDAKKLTTERPTTSNNTSSSTNNKTNGKLAVDFGKKLENDSKPKKEKKSSKLKLNILLQIELIRVSCNNFNKRKFVLPQHKIIQNSN